jgi:hypothetical protein
MQLANPHFFFLSTRVGLGTLPPVPLGFLEISVCFLIKNGGEQVLCESSGELLQDLLKRGLRFHHHLDK